MATRSRIGIELKNGSVLSAYHHWDGYPEWLGRILNTHYNTRAKAAELIDGGDMSTCWNEENQPEYYSARGENCPPRHDADLNEYLSDGEEYAYVFSKGNWVCYDLHGAVHPTIVKEVPIPTAALAG